MIFVRNIIQRFDKRLKKGHPFLAQPDIAACGGISEFLKICVLASTFGVTVIPHVWGSAVGLAAGLHAVATLPPSPYTANPIYLENEVKLTKSMHSHMYS